MHHSECMSWIIIQQYLYTQYFDLKKKKELFAIYAQSLMIKDCVKMINQSTQY